MLGSTEVDCPSELTSEVCAVKRRETRTVRGADAFYQDRVPVFVVFHMAIKWESELVAEVEP